MIVHLIIMCFGGSDLAMCSRAVKLDHDVCMLHNIVLIPLVGGDKEKRASISLLCVHLGILCIGQGRSQEFTEGGAGYRRNFSQPRPLITARDFCLHELRTFE